MKEDIKNHLRTIGIAVASSVPIIGGLISVLLDEYLPNFIQNKRDQFLNSLSFKLDELEKNGFNLNLNNDVFISTFLKAGRISLEEVNEEKLIALKNIVLNAAIPKSTDFEESTLFLSWIRDFTGDQIRVLKAVKDIDEIKFHNTPHLEKALNKIFPEVKEDYLTICARELSIKNVISYQKDSGNEKPNWVLTDLGKRFVGYIEYPTKTAHNKT